MNYKKLNNILGWSVFAIATFVFLWTMEKTTSLWDCGEYITTAYKLEVGHPPGAPFFMMLGRLFSAFVDKANAAMMVNSMSALSSSFTILFLFWTISMLGRKLALANGGEITKEKTVAILGSALVGSLAYTFTDSFWFSAVEGEVYAMSSFFTAIVFWAILKWEIEVDEHEAGVEGASPNRWIVFISYMVGLSIGVHLLNLLAIPAIAFVIYFKKFKFEIKSFLIAGIAALGTLGIVQSVLIPKIPTVADAFERFFTNSIGAPFNIGFLFFVLLLAGGLTYGIYYTAKKGKTLWNNIVVSLTVLILGYSTFAMIVVRSNANPPLDENNPETLSSLVSYLNRDQYGSWPLLSGPYWNTPSAYGGCDEEAMLPPKTSFMKVYASTLKQTSITTSADNVKRIKTIVAPLSIQLEVKKKGNEYQVSTPRYPDYVLYDGKYEKPNAGIAAELDQPLQYELSFINLFEFNTYKKKVAEANKTLKESNIKFQIDLAPEVTSKYVNMLAGKAGERKHLTNYDVKCLDGQVRTVTYTTIFPRMWRPGEGNKYMNWVEYHSTDHSVPLPADPQLAQYGVPGTNKWEQYQSVLEADENLAKKMYQEGLFKPTFGENIEYMAQYQIGFMYLRYFMWNFAGRQNDIQGYGVNSGGKRLLEGNWLSGVDFVDSERLGSQDNLPQFIAQNPGYNKYFFLPLILGLIGFIFHVVKSPKDWFTILLLFLLTGLAIVIYLNQKPMEPRERDYAYAASFYAFAIWVGLGVYALYDVAKSFNLKKIGIIAAYCFGVGIFIYLAESVIDGGHAFSYSILYMSAIGVGVYFALGFIGDKLKNGVISGGLATSLALAVPIVLAVQNWDDHDRSNRSTASDFAYNYLASCAQKSENGKGAILFTNGDNDTFPVWYIQEVEDVRTDVRVANMSLLGTDWHINQMKRQAYDSEPWDLPMNEFSYRNGTRDYIIVDENPAKEGKYYSAKEAMAFILDDNNRSSKYSTCQEESFIDFKGIYIDVDKEAALAHGIITEEQLPKVKDRIEWTLKGGVIYKSDMAVLALLADHEWDRPIYFASLAGLQANSSLTKYLQAEGLIFKLTPIDHGQGGGVNSDWSYDLFMDEENGFRWGNMKDPDVFVGYYSLRMVYSIRAQVMKLTDDLIAKGQKEKAIAVLDRVFEEMPIEDNQVAPDDICYYLCANYYDAGAKEKGDALAKQLAEIKLNEMKYYLGQEDRFFVQMASEWAKSFSLVELLRVTANKEEVQAQQTEHNEQLNALNTEYQTQMDTLNAQMQQGLLGPEVIQEMQQKIIEEITAKQVSIQEDYQSASADESQTYFKLLGPLEGTAYIDLVQKSKEAYFKYKMNNQVNGLFDPEKREFPLEYIDLWDSQPQGQ